MFAPGPRVSHAMMAKKLSNEDIEAVIAAAFRHLGYPIVKAEQLEAARASSVIKFLRFLVSSILLRQSWHGLQDFRGSTVAILKAHLGHEAFELAL